MDRNARHFLLRRLHSLTGIVPAGVFVIMHLFTNFQLAVGDFQHEVEFIHSLPALLVLELTIWLAIGFHGVLGLVYTFSGAQPNARRYSYADNWRYTFQRITGILALVFIFLHVATLRWGWSIGGWFTPFYVEGPDGEPLATATTANALQHAWWVPVVYLIGALSVVYHWSNGLWTAAITWGLTISERAMRRWGWVCGVMGVALAVFAVGAVVAAMNDQVTERERQLIEQRISGPAGQQAGDVSFSARNGPEGSRRDGG